MKIRAFTLLLSLFPAAFSAVYADATWHTILGYALFVAAHALIWRACALQGRLHLLLVSNLLSFLSSQVFAILTNLQAMAEYFKPLTSHTLILILSAAALLIELLFYLLYKKRKA